MSQFFILGGHGSVGDGILLHFAPEGPDDIDAVIPEDDGVTQGKLVPVIERYTRPVAAGMVRQNRENKRLMRQKKREARRLKAGGGKKEKDT